LLAKLFKTLILAEVFHVESMTMKLNRLEPILATAIYLFILIFAYSQNAGHQTLRQAVALSAYITVIYGSFMAFTQWISPKLLRNGQVENGVALTLLLFFASWWGLSVCLWIREYPAIRPGTFWNYLPRGASLGAALLTVVLLIAYESLKLLARYAQGGNKTNPLMARIAGEVLVVLSAAAVIFALLLTVDNEPAGLWLSAVLYAYALYAISTYWLIPLCEKRRYRLAKYLLLAVPLSFVLFIPFGLFFLAFTSAPEELFFLEWLAVILLMLPLSYYLYSRQKTRIAQLLTLRTELGQASADLSFLRSQINPHFLFNILNTLYGTALQEDAERTAAGIQKLGDMMRFMLHENNQDRILLAREVEYLRNYIDLQLLRTATSPDVTVDCDIRDSLENMYVAPMLLIPFVENAFKHGISLKKKSWIKISLYAAGNKLFFDVHNSIHQKPESDPEKHHSGIGLDNVRQRLAMVYPNRHELVIRETKQEFFIHVTVQL